MMYVFFLTHEMTDPHRHRTISLVANKHVVGKNDQRRRGLMIRESLRVPKLLPGDGVISEMQEEAQRKQNELEQDDNGTKNCDIAFYDCLTSSACTDCFYEMKSKDIDWTGVTENTDCDVVVPILTKAGICTRLPVLEKDKQLFCDAFHACVYFDENDDKDEKGSDNEDDKDKIDCSALTECNWPGFHESFVGDGVCHDNYGNSCYNSAVCNWDGGDCCKDTCKSEKGSYLQCGTDGFSCRNPNSTDCDPSLTVMCPSDKKNNNEKEPPKCDKVKTLYRLDLFDRYVRKLSSISRKIAWVLSFLFTCFAESFVQSYANHSPSMLVRLLSTPHLPVLEMDGREPA